MVRKTENGRSVLQSFCKNVAKCSKSYRCLLYVLNIIIMRVVDTITALLLYGVLYTSIRFFYFFGVCLNQLQLAPNFAHTLVTLVHRPMYV